MPPNLALAMVYEINRAHKIVPILQKTKHI